MQPEERRKSGMERQIRRQSWMWGGMAALSCASLLAGPLAARAQQPAASQAQSADEVRLENKKVSLQIEDGRLTQAIKLLMESVGANYTLDARLQGAVVTASLTHVPLRTALETLLKASSIPATYRMEDNIYSFELQQQTPDVQAGLPQTGPAKTEEGKEKQITKISLLHIDPADIVPALGGQVFQVNYQNYGILGGNNGTGRQGSGLLGDFSGIGNTFGPWNGGGNTAGPGIGGGAAGTGSGSGR